MSNIMRTNNPTARPLIDTVFASAMTCSSPLQRVCILIDYYGVIYFTIELYHNLQGGLKHILPIASVQPW
jgi:hypothetical protein